MKTPLLLDGDNAKKKMQTIHFLDLCLHPNIQSSVWYTKENRYFFVFEPL